jgi:hypothetical protein
MAWTTTYPTAILFHFRSGSGYLPPVPLIKILLIIGCCEGEFGIFIKIRQLKSSVANYEKIRWPISKKIAQTQNDLPHLIPFLNQR